MNFSTNFHGVSESFLIHMYKTSDRIPCDSRSWQIIYINFVAHMMVNLVDQVVNLVISKPSSAWLGIHLVKSHFVLEEGLM